MKKVSILIIIALLASVFSAWTAFADDSAEFEYYYDFEDYSAGLSSRVMPDENWSYEKTNGSRHKFGAYENPQTGDKSMQIAYGGEPILWFNRNVTEGKLHISFNFSFTGAGRRCLVMLYDGRKANDAYTIGVEDTYYSKAAYINSPAGKLRWYQTDPGSDNAFSMIGWNAQTSDKEIEVGKQYRMDIITTEIGSSDASANYYLDGQPINETPVYFSQSKGFKALAFRCEGENDDSVMLLDNVRVNRFFGEEGITGTIKGSNQIPHENGELEIALSEQVDPTLLTPENITVTNRATGETVSGFDVINASADGFTVKFTETLKSGTYTLMLSDRVRGGVLNSKMTVPVEFRTEYRSERRYVEYLKLNFDDYTYAPGAENPPSAGEDNSSLPEGFRNIGRLADTYAESVDGPGGGDDRALGFVNPPASRIPSRFIYTFEGAVAPLSEYEVSFDVKYENMYWYMYLLEPGDDDADTEGYRENTAIATVNSGGNLYYAEQRTESRLRKISELTVPKNEWHTVKLKVVPQIGSGAKYKISVDGGAEYTFSVSRRFDVNSTEGIGFGYTPTGDRTGYLYIDNVSVSSTMDVLYPETESISFINYDGTVLSGTSVFTTLMSKIYIDFNTAVDEDSAKSKIRISGGENLKYNIVFENIDGKTRAIAELPELLEKAEEYTVSVSEGIASKFSGDIISEVPITKNFTTKRDTSFRIFENEFDAAAKTYTAKFVKNTDDSGKYTVAAVGYKNVEKIINGTAVTVPQMVGISYKPLDITSETKGITEVILSVDFGTDCDSCKAFLQTYPQLHNVYPGENNSIK